MKDDAELARRRAKSAAERAGDNLSMDRRANNCHNRPHPFRLCRRAAAAASGCCLVLLDSRLCYSASKWNCEPAALEVWKAPRDLYLLSSGSLCSRESAARRTFSQSNCPSRNGHEKGCRGLEQRGELRRESRHNRHMLWPTDRRQAGAETK